MIVSANCEGQAKPNRTYSLDVVMCHVIIPLPYLLIALEKCEGSFPVLDYEKEKCTIPSSYFEQTYLQCNGILYRRAGVSNLFTFLAKNLIGNNVGWIYGPPGCGKSTASFAFAMTIDRSKWGVSYLTCGTLGVHSFVHFEEDKKSSLVFSNIEQMSDLLQSLSSGLKNSNRRKHILFVDGVCLSKQPSGPGFRMITACTLWFRKDIDHRRLVYIASMAGRSILPSTITEVEMELFKLYSWTLDEYKAAIAVEGFWENIKNFMDSSSAGNETPLTNEDLLISKYHFAGGSSRFMFQKTTTKVIDCIYQAITKVSNLQDVALGNTGEESAGVINQLYGHYEGESEPHVISDFALRSIAIKLGPELIKRIIRITNATKNPSLLGQFLEIWFFQSIRSGGIELCDRKSNEKENWEASDHVLDFDPDNITDRTLLGAPTWYRPKKFNQGGYDAVYVNIEQGITRFVQLSKAKDHPFKICAIYCSNSLSTQDM